MKYILSQCKKISKKKKFNFCKISGQNDPTVRLEDRRSLGGWNRKKSSDPKTTTLMSTFGGGGRMLRSFVTTNEYKLPIIR